MSALIWTLEWSVATSRHRLFALNALIPLLLVGPIAFSAAPAQHAAAVYAVLFTIFGTFGSCIPLIRDGESGLLTRFTLAGVPPRTLLAERVLAAVALDTVQLLPSVGVIALASGGGARLGVVASALVLTLLVANLLGVWAAAFARSVAEGALFAAVLSLMLLHAGGTFRTPVAGSFGARVEALIPFRLLHESLLGLTSGGPPVAGGASPTEPLLVTLGLAAVTLLAARRIVAVPERARHG